MLVNEKVYGRHSGCQPGVPAERRGPREEQLWTGV